MAQMIDLTGDDSSPEPDSSTALSQFNPRKQRQNHVRSPVSQPAAPPQQQQTRDRPERRLEPFKSDHHVSDDPATTFKMPRGYSSSDSPEESAKSLERSKLSDKIYGNGGNKAPTSQSQSQFPQRLYGKGASGTPASQSRNQPPQTLYGKDANKMTASESQTDPRLLGGGANKMQSSPSLIESRVYGRDSSNISASQPQSQPQRQLYGDDASKTYGLGNRNNGSVDTRPVESTQDMPQRTKQSLPGVTQYDVPHYLTGSMSPGVPAPKNGVPKERQPSVAGRLSQDSRPVLSPPVLAGSRLAIVDQAPPPLSRAMNGIPNGISNGVSRLKRVFTSSPSAVDATPPASQPAKRQRLEEAPSTLQGPQSHAQDIQPPAQSTPLFAVKEVAPLRHDHFVTRPSKSSGTASSSRPTQPDVAPFPPAEEELPLPPLPDPSESRFGIPWSAEEMDLLVRLKEVHRLPWSQVDQYFNGRTSATIQNRYSTIKSMRQNPKSVDRGPAKRKSRNLQAEIEHPVSSGNESGQSKPRRQATRRNVGASVVDGFVSWAQIKEMRRAVESEEVEEAIDPATQELMRQDHTHTSSLSRLLRQRELGRNGGRGWVSFYTKGPSDEFKNHVFDHYEPKRYFMNTSGDVTCVAWSKEDKFAAGSVAITDNRSMQYNSNCNLLLGDCERAELQELADHYVPRPVVSADPANVNSLDSMRETQDPRLFMTVATVQFSPDGGRLYTGGSDGKVNVYDVRGHVQGSKLKYSIEHPAPIDLLAVSQNGVLATACHQSGDGSIGLYQCEDDYYDQTRSLASARTDTDSQLPSFPGALKWGIASHHRKFLLAGFSSDNFDDEQEMAGGTALWNAETGQRLHINGVTRNVFDVAWNPSATHSSTAFAVASMRGNAKLNKSMRSVIQCYAPDQNGAREVLAWQCPAFDINDLAYCPHDDNLIAAGATDGNVYVWDKRFAHEKQTPLHTLKHGVSVNVLDHDREIEDIDTGVRFLSWGATSSRLYTGSSDGVVKVWNPYRSPDNAFIKDAATFSTAIMSGAFSPDYENLLVGEECGRLNLLSLEQREQTAKPPRRFRLHSAPASKVPEEESAVATANELLRTGQIELRPMGVMPIRQAVQGPNYSGPFISRGDEESRVTEHERAFAEAVDRQGEVHSRAAMKAWQTSGPSAAQKAADGAVSAALEALEAAKKNFDDLKHMEHIAEQHQISFVEGQELQEAIDASLDSPHEPCKLDCNYLPKHNEEGALVPVTTRYEQRIPGALRSLPRNAIDVQSLDCRDLFNYGLAAACPFCNVRKASKQQKIMNQMRCRARSMAIKHALSETCDECSAPVHAGNGIEGERRLCERCGLACFRCGERAVIEGDVERVICEQCKLSWKAGVLGYELENVPTKRSRGKGKEKVLERNRNSDSDIGNDNDDYDDFNDDGDEDVGSTEMEYYASLWKVHIPSRPAGG